MKNMINFILELFMIKHSQRAVGLTQFQKTLEEKSKPKEISIKAKDVKLSDLMRRASWEVFYNNDKKGRT